MSDTTSDPLREYERFEREGGVALVARDVVEVSGPDTARYLQGQLSQEVVALADGSSTWSLLLQPTGKVDAWVRVHRDLDDHYLVEVDAGFGELVAARLRRFLLRTKADVTDPGVWTMVATRRPPTHPVVGEPDEPGPADALLSGTPPGPGVAGLDLLNRGTEALVDTASRVGPESYERYRIAHAVPAMGRELTEETIPAEAGQWLVDVSVSFTKGCYTGQELVARIDSRGGNVPRPVRLVVVEGGSTPAVGGAVLCGEDEVGHVTSASPWLAHHQPALALAPLKRSVDVGAAVEVETDAGRAPGIVVEPPFTGHGAG
jgi:folate-binding protein YgfZ